MLDPKQVGWYCEHIEGEVHKGFNGLGVVKTKTARAFEFMGMLREADRCPSMVPVFALPGTDKENN